MEYKYGAPDKYGDFPYLYSYKKEELNDILRERLPEDYNMELVDQNECDVLAACVNQGIDSHLEACTMSDKFEVHDRKIGDTVVQRHLGGAFDKDGMICLIRRLMEFDANKHFDFEGCEPSEENPDESQEERDTWEAAYSLVSSILETLQIEYHGC